MKKYTIFLSAMFGICGDATGDLVRIRIEGAHSGLHAAEARYQGFF